MKCRGWLPDPPHVNARYGSARRLFGSPVLAQGLTSLAVYEPPIFDQGQTQSCEGHAGAAATALALTAAGVPLGFIPSPDFLYKVARCRERLSLAPLTDEGATTSGTIAALALGLLPMGARPPDGRFSDVDASTVNGEPRLSALAVGSHNVVTGEYAIPLGDTGEALALIQAALKAGFPVRLDIIADAAVEAYSGGVLTGSGPGGGHAVYCTELYVSSGNAVVGFTNSWGGGWGVGARDPAAPNRGGHGFGDATWFTQAVQGAYVWKCIRGQL